MRRFLAIVLALLPAFGQQPADSVFACFTELPLPTYPEIALMAHVQGAVIAEATIVAGGQVELTKTSGPTLLRDPIVRMLKGARANPICERRSFRLEHWFELMRTLPDGRSLEQSVVFEAPNLFRIRSDRHDPPPYVPKKGDPPPDN